MPHPQNKHERFQKGLLKAHLRASGFLAKNPYKEVDPVTLSMALRSSTTCGINKDVNPRKLGYKTRQERSFEESFMV